MFDSCFSQVMGYVAVDIALASRDLIPVEVMQRLLPYTLSHGRGGCDSLRIHDWIYLNSIPCRLRPSTSWHFPVANEQASAAQ